MQTLTKKYGLLTAIAMVVGIVIGSGVFFKAQDILSKTGGDLTASIMAWICGGLIMVVCALAFSFMATKYERAGGIVDYAEAVVGSRYSYYVGWFVATVYMPSITSVLAWVSARYTIVFINSVDPGFASDPVTGPECMVLTLVYMVTTYAINTLSPKIAGKFQVVGTIIKLIPLILMGVIGVVVGISSGTLQENFATQPSTDSSRMSLFFIALVSVAFAYDGWMVSTSVNAELRDSKRNLPLALTIGTLMVVIVCVLYNLGVAGSATMQEISDPDIGTSRAFTNLFGGGMGAVLNLFVAISCLATLNGLMLASARTMYSLASRGKGPHPDMFASIDEKTNIPANSAIIGLFFAMLWFLYFYAANLVGWCGDYGFDSSELPIVTQYAMYIPIYIMFMKKGKEFGTFKRFVIPALAIGGSMFMVYAAASSHGIGTVYYLIVFALFMAAGRLFEHRRNKKTDS